MIRLTDEQQQIVIENMNIIDIAWSKFKNRDDLVPYKEEIKSEGYYRLCVAASYIDKTKAGLFSYLYKAVINAMFDFIQDFIYPQANVLSVENEGLQDFIEHIQKQEKLQLSKEVFITDLLNDYIAKMNDKVKYRKNGPTCPNTIKQLFIILSMLYDGYTEVEIGVKLGVTKQRIDQYLRLLKDALRN